MELKKKWITETVDFDQSLLDGSIPEVLHKLTAYYAQLDPKYRKARLEYYSEDYEGGDYRVRAEREETDAEFNRRVKRIEAQQKTRELKASAKIATQLPNVQDVQGLA